MMSKRNYQAIARAIHETRLVRAFTVAIGDERTPFAALVDNLSDVFAADNPRFDRRRFEEACETGRCKGMPR